LDNFCEFKIWTAPAGQIGEDRCDPFNPCKLGKRDLKLKLMIKDDNESTII